MVGAPPARGRGAPEVLCVEDGGARGGGVRVQESAGVRCVDSRCVETTHNSWGEEHQT